MFWACFITNLYTREIGYENHPTLIYLTWTQAQSWTQCSSGRDINLATRQDTLGLTPILALRLLRHR